MKHAFLAGFDGTWSQDRLGPEDDTVVVRFMRRFGDGSQADYHPGVSGILGGLFGWGARRRIRSAMTAWDRAGRPPVYAVGWSRGAATVERFSRLVLEHGGAVRWIGLIDSVRSFGLPGGFEWGFRRNLPKGVDYALHLVATETPFRRTRYPGAHEVLVEGSHAELGGKHGPGPVADNVLARLCRSAADHGAPMSKEDCLCPTEA